MRLKLAVTQREEIGELRSVGFEIVSLLTERARGLDAPASLACLQVERSVEATMCRPGCRTCAIASRLALR